MTRTKIRRGPRTRLRTIIRVKRDKEGKIPMKAKEKD